MALQEPELYSEEEYYKLPEDVRAELIEGQIYYQAAPGRIHQKLISIFNYTIFNYIKSKGGRCEVYPAPFAVKLFQDDTTIVEPDISVVCDKDKLTSRGCTGAPDWIIEVASPGSLSHDYIRKLNLYAAAGVREYWIVNPMNESVYVYHLEENSFKVISYSFQEQVKVNIYEDLYIDFADMEL